MSKTGLIPKLLGLGLLLLPWHLLAEEKVYNESHFYFALLTVVTIPLGGAILGGLADLLMRQIGIDLKSRALREN